MTEKEIEKSEIAKKEEEILKFWKQNKIFEKSLAKPSPKGEFVFYDGPPFATGLPHYGNLLSSIIKDVIPRYKTMRGFHVRRRWGWDCHGLPIESLVEKQLELKTKKDIENVGIKEFNETAREMVLKYADEWEEYIDRIGRWTEFRNSYKTMDNSYIESVWWAISEIHKKGLLYEGRKVLMYCPHCETPLAKAEIAMDNSYKNVTEEAVTVEFKVKNPEKLGLKGDIFLLAWTTTPWTLPGNVALAVGGSIEYFVLRKSNEKAIIVSKRSYLRDKEKFNGYFLQVGFSGEKNSELIGKDLLGLRYEPLFDIPEIRRVDKDNKAYRVYEADFVTTEDGTGIVHTAVMYGEDDFKLGEQVGLPMVSLLDASGKYNNFAPEYLRGKFIKKAEKEIKEDLENRSLLFDKAPNTHSYPHCYRCGTALIYNALNSWFINIQKVKKEIIKNNEKVSWHPEHLKHGRFGNIIENAPDWTISRNRYWASPLPIWKNEKTGEVKVIGSIKELKKFTKKSGNKYFSLRHGEAEQNVNDIINSDPNNIFSLTEKGKEQVEKITPKIKSKKIDLIFISPFERCKETAKIVCGSIGLPKEALFIDERLSELNAGPSFEGKKWNEYSEYFKDGQDRFKVAPEGGETLSDLNRRVGEFLFELENRYSGKNILIVTHKAVITALHNLSLSADFDLAEKIKKHVKYNPNQADFDEFEFTLFPHNRDYFLDLHRPHIDEIPLFDKGIKLKRITEVVDCWLESGSMPFAELNYPFSPESKKEFKKRFPGDFIAEYIAQTRTWFYYTHTLGTILFDSNAFRNVSTTGTILASDGAKISKSKGNYTDPLLNIDKFSADALRFYLMSSVVMQAEDLKYRDDELRETHNKVINLLWNSFKFFKLYNKETQEIKSKNILDEWIRLRLSEIIRQITEGFEDYDTSKALRSVPKFIDDFSTWYIRRSRDRFKNDDNMEDKLSAISTTKRVLLELSKVLAPIIPFLSEIIYQGVKNNTDKESVHLCDWPKFEETDKKVLEAMEETRRVVSLALEKRNTSGIKVKQPLRSLKVKDLRLRGKEDYLKLIKDEVNVKEIVFDNDMSEEVEFDTEITSELLREGLARDFIRKIQDFRKKANLTPSQEVVIQIKTDEEGKKFLTDFEPEINKTTKVKLEHQDVSEGEEIKVGEYHFLIGLVTLD